MSGGDFNDDGYIYYKVEQFADELEEKISNNHVVKDEWGYAPNYSPEVIKYLRAQLRQMRRIAKIMRHIDYLYSGDYDEDIFMYRVKELEKHWGEVENLSILMEKWNEEDGV